MDKAGTKGNNQHVATVIPSFPNAKIAIRRPFQPIYARKAAPVLVFCPGELLLTPVVPANNHKGCAGPVPKFCNLLSCSENWAPD